MRISKPSASSSRSADEIRARYLGEIAPLLDAARRLDSLSPERKRLVRRRILRTTFGTARLVLRMRPAAVAIALAALVVGGAAFAAAERFGLIPGIGKTPRSDNDAPTNRPHAARSDKRRGSATLPSFGSQLSASVVILPEIPDPLLLALPSASTFGWRVLGESAAAGASVAPAARPQQVAIGVHASEPTRSILRRRIAYAVPVPVTSAPQHDVFIPPSSVPTLPQVDWAATAAAPPVVPPSAPPPPATLAPPPARPAGLAKDDLRPLPSDTVLFGQAMRKLRAEHNPSGALVALQEHAHAYPRSSLSAERSVLEVESLLALHRARDALSRLDAMSLDELPRAGERLVVRGELRAGAGRWPEASEDFDRALSRVSGSPAWYERALWGRAVARLRCGEREAGLADVESYRDRYPNGRFAAEAARFLVRR